MLSNWIIHQEFSVQKFVRAADFSIKAKLNPSFINFLIRFLYSINFELSHVDNITQKFANDIKKSPLLSFGSIFIAFSATFHHSQFSASCLRNLSISWIRKEITVFLANTALKVLPQTVVARVQQFLHVPLGVYLISMRFIKNWHSCAQCVAISIFIIIIPISITISRSAIFMNFPPSYYYLFGPVSCRRKPEIFLLAKIPWTKLFR